MPSYTTSIFDIFGGFMLTVEKAYSEGKSHFIISLRRDDSLLIEPIIITASEDETIEITT